MEEQELLEMYHTFSDAWKLFKDFSKNPSDTEKYWKALSIAVRTFSENHGKTKLSIDLGVTVLREMERRSLRKDDENWKQPLGRDQRVVSGLDGIGEGSWPNGNDGEKGEGNDEDRAGHHGVLGRGGQ